MGLGFHLSKLENKSINSFNSAVRRLIQTVLVKEKETLSQVAEG